MYECMTSTSKIPFLLKQASYRISHTMYILCLNYFMMFSAEMALSLFIEANLLYCTDNCVSPALLSKKA